MVGAHPVGTQRYLHIHSEYRLKGLRVGLSGHTSAQPDPADKKIESELN
jgi:hypothetical protein